LGSTSTFCVLQRGFDITKSQQAEGSVPVVSSGGIKSYHNVAKIGEPGVIVGRKGTLGLVHYVEVPYWPHDTTLYVKDFRGNHPRFAAYFCDHLNFARYNSGGINPTLNRNTVHAEIVGYPTKDEQVEIADTLNQVEIKQRIAERSATTLQSFFRTLLHQLMTAQIRVHDLDLSALDDERHVELTAQLAGAP
jgi:type I restriction enzyme S subunit